MYKTIIVLPDGTEISSGTAASAAIKSLRLTGCVNSGTQLTPGSVCAAMAEAELIVTGEAPQLAAGLEVKLFQEDETGTRHKLGLFTLEAPSRPTPGRLRFTAYDRVAKLDKDLTAWLNALEGWPYTALDFAKMVCEACGVRLLNSGFANGDYPVARFSGTYTARQLMGYIAQLAGTFCHADADGSIYIEYYNDWGAELTATDCFLGGLSHADYAVEAVDAVQLRLGETLYGGEGENPYVISGNPLLSAVTEQTLAALENIRQRLPGGFVPCQLEIPADPHIRPGHILTVTDREGFTFRTLVMEKVSYGQKDTLKCTGTRLRTDASALYGKSVGEIAKEAVQSQTQQDIFDKLTNYGQVQGFYLQDGKLYINAELVQIVNLVAAVLESRLDASALRIDGAALTLTSGGQVTAEVNNTAPGLPILYLNDYGEGTLKHRCELSPHHLRLGGSGVAAGVVLEIDADGTPRLTLGTDGEPLRLLWKANGDGTYTLTGT